MKRLLVLWRNSRRQAKHLAQRQIPQPMRHWNGRKR